MSRQFSFLFLSLFLNFFHGFDCGKLRSEDLEIAARGELVKSSKFIGLGFSFCADFCLEAGFSIGEFNFGLSSASFSLSFGSFFGQQFCKCSQCKVPQLFITKHDACNPALGDKCDQLCQVNNFASGSCTDYNGPCTCEGNGKINKCPSSYFEWDKPNQWHCGNNCPPFVTAPPPTTPAPPPPTTSAPPPPTTPAPPPPTTAAPPPPTTAAPPPPTTAAPPPPTTAAPPPPTTAAPPPPTTAAPPPPTTAAPPPPTTAAPPPPTTAAPPPPTTAAPPPPTTAAPPPPTTAAPPPPTTAAPPPPTTSEPPPQQTTLGGTENDPCDSVWPCFSVDEVGGEWASIISGGALPPFELSPFANRPKNSSNGLRSLGIDVGQPAYTVPPYPVFNYYKCDVRILCESQISEYIGNPFDCGSFYMCSENGPTKLYCPDGLEWNEEEAVCDWKLTSNCQITC